MLAAPRKTPVTEIRTAHDTGRRRCCCRGYSAAARLPTKESRVKWRGGNPPTNDCCTQRTASAQAAVRAKVLANLIEPRAVRAAVKTASRLRLASRPVLTGAVRGAVSISQAGTEKRALKPNKETSPWPHEVLAAFNNGPVMR